MKDTQDVYCKFDNTTMSCTRCGYQAQSLPTYRVCRTIPEMAEHMLQQSTTHRISVPPLMIGTMIAKAMSSIGITDERVSAVIGKPCGCKNRAVTLDHAGAALSKAVERAANVALNLTLPAPYTQEEVAEAANMIAASEWINPGLRKAAAAGQAHTPGNPESPPPG